MEKKAHEPPNGFKIYNERELFALMDDRLPKVTCLGFDSLPESLRHIVANYISDDEGDRTKRALLGEQRITLCLSQYANLELGSCWHFGCLSHEDEWETSREARVDKQYLIKDSESCLDYLGRENSAHCPIVVEVLVLLLDITSPDFQSALDDLQGTLVVLQEHLNNVQHVVFAIEKHAFFCFSLKDIIDNTTGRRHTVNRPVALEQILIDLRSCRITNQMFGTFELLHYYIVKDDKPLSDKYLSKFLISLNNRQNQYLFDVIKPTSKPSKLRWLYHVETIDEVNNIDRTLTSHCHAFHLDLPKIDRRANNFPVAYFFKDNPFIERIVISSALLGCPIQLPRPSEPLTDNTPRSALIELTLKGHKNTLHLTHLNNNYFPNLRHLSVIEGTVTGRLDSQSVPNLKTLRIEPRKIIVFVIPSKVDALIHEHTQAIIDSDRPWQLVTSSNGYGGWSLASYDEPIANPQDEEKENLSSSLPVIKDLMLVMGEQQHADEYQSRLSGNPSLEATAGEQNVPLLVWDPECVEKITAFCRNGRSVQLEFMEPIPEQTRILTSLTCHNLGVVLNGDALPHLQSLELNNGQVTMSGAFPHLESLFFKDTGFDSPMQLDAPLLQSLHCHQLFGGKNLSLRPQSLPYLSSLRIDPGEVQFSDEHFPKIIVDEDISGLLRNTHVVFGKGMTKSPCFDQWQVQNVSHLELAVDACKLPACWENTHWQCETLTISFYTNNHYRLREQGITGIKMPPLLPELKKLTVTETVSHVLLDSEMPKLTDLTVKSPGMLGPNLKCPTLRCICFTGELSDSDKKKCLDPTTYEAIGAHPRWVYLRDSGEVRRMSWDVVPSAIGVSTFAGPLEDGGNCCVSHE